MTSAQVQRWLRFPLPERQAHANRGGGSPCVTALGLTDRGGSRAVLSRRLVLAEADELSGESQSAAFGLCRQFGAETDAAI